jgi:hypothetical protein
VRVVRGDDGEPAAALVGDSGDAVGVGRCHVLIMLQAATDCNT